MREQFKFSGLTRNNIKRPIPENGKVILFDEQRLLGMYFAQVMYLVHWTLYVEECGLFANS